MNIARADGSKTARSSVPPDATPSFDLLTLPSFESLVPFEIETKAHLDKALECINAYFESIKPASQFKSIADAPLTSRKTARVTAPPSNSSATHAPPSNMSLTASLPSARLLRRACTEGPGKQTTKSFISSLVPASTVAQSLNSPSSASTANMSSPTTTADNGPYTCPSKSAQASITTPTSPSATSAAITPSLAVTPPAKLITSRLRAPVAPAALSSDSSGDGDASPTSTNAATSDTNGNTSTTRNNAVASATYTPATTTTRHDSTNRSPEISSKDKNFGKRSRNNLLISGNASAKRQASMEIIPKTTIPDLVRPLNLSLIEKTRNNAENNRTHADMGACTGTSPHTSANVCVGLGALSGTGESDLDTNHAGSSDGNGDSVVGCDDGHSCHANHFYKDNVDGGAGANMDAGANAALENIVEEDVNDVISTDSDIVVKPGDNIDVNVDTLASISVVSSDVLTTTSINPTTAAANHTAATTTVATPVNTTHFAPSLGGFRVPPIKPIPVTPSTMPLPQRLQTIATYLDEIGYNFTGPDLTPHIQSIKMKPYTHIQTTASLIAQRSLPIKCLEAVVLALAATARMPCVRFVLRFQTFVDGRKGGKKGGSGAAVDGGNGVVGNGAALMGGSGAISGGDVGSESSLQRGRSVVRTLANMNTLQGTSGNFNADIDIYSTHVLPHDASALPATSSVLPGPPSASLPSSSSGQQSRVRTQSTGRAQSRGRAVSSGRALSTVRGVVGAGNERERERERVHSHAQAHLLTTTHTHGTANSSDSDSDSDWDDEEEEIGTTSGIYGNLKNLDQEKPVFGKINIFPELGNSESTNAPEFSDLLTSSVSTLAASLSSLHAMDSTAPVPASMASGPGASVSIPILSLPSSTSTPASAVQAGITPQSHTTATATAATPAAADLPARNTYWHIVLVIYDPLSKRFYSLGISRRPLLGSRGFGESAPAPEIHDRKSPEKLSELATSAFTAPSSSSSSSAAAPALALAPVPALSATSSYGFGSFSSLVASYVCEYAAIGHRIRQIVVGLPPLDGFTENTNDHVYANLGVKRAGFLDKLLKEREKEKEREHDRERHTEPETEKCDTNKEEKELDPNDFPKQNLSKIPKLHIPIERNEKEKGCERGRPEYDKKMKVTTSASAGIDSSVGGGGGTSRMKEGRTDLSLPLFMLESTHTTAAVNCGNNTIATSGSSGVNVVKSGALTSRTARDGINTHRYTSSTYMQTSSTTTGGSAGSGNGTKGDEDVPGMRWHMLYIRIKRLTAKNQHNIASKHKGVVLPAPVPTLSPKASNFPTQIPSFTSYSPIKTEHRYQVPEKTVVADVAANITENNVVTTETSTSSSPTASSSHSHFTSSSPRHRTLTRSSDIHPHVRPTPPLLPPYNRAIFAPFEPPALFHGQNWAVLAEILDAYAVNIMSVRNAVVCNKTLPHIPHCVVKAKDRSIKAKIYLQEK